jgi:hypothetical protein
MLEINMRVYSGRLYPGTAFTTVGKFSPVVSTCTTPGNSSRGVDGIFTDRAIPKMNRGFGISGERSNRGVEQF